jgi:hypothetical protein
MSTSLLLLTAAVSTVACKVSPRVVATPGARSASALASSQAPSATPSGEAANDAPEEASITVDYLPAPGLERCRLEIRGMHITEERDHYEVEWMNHVRSLGVGCNPMELFPDPTQPKDDCKDCEVPLACGAVVKPDLENSSDAESRIIGTGEPVVVRFVDFDFDGYLDILMTVSQASWNNGYLGYRFDPSRHILVPVPAFRSMGSVDIDPKKRRIHSTRGAGATGYGLQEFGWENGELVDLREESHDRDKGIVEVYERRNGRLILTERRKEDSK